MLMQVAAQHFGHQIFLRSELRLGVCSLGNLSGHFTSDSMRGGHVFMSQDVAGVGCFLNHVARFASRRWSFGSGSICFHRVGFPKFFFVGLSSCPYMYIYIIYIYYILYHAFNFGFSFAAVPQINQNSSIARLCSDSEGDITEDIQQSFMFFV